MAKFISNLKDPVIKILLFALGVNILFLFHGGDVAETVGIALSVLIATLISTLSEHGSESAFLSLGKSGEGEVCRETCFCFRRARQLRRTDFCFRVS